MRLEGMLNELLHLLEIGQLRRKEGKYCIQPYFEGVVALSPEKYAVHTAIGAAMSPCRQLRLFAPADLTPQQEQTVGQIIRTRLQRIRLPEEVITRALDEFEEAFRKLIELENRRRRERVKTAL